MQKKIIYLKGQPLVFLSANGSGGKSPAEQAALCLNRINEELKILGGSLEDLVMTTVFTKNQECRPQVSEVRKKMLPQATRPASASIIVYRFLPEDTIVEIDALAMIPRGKKFQKMGIEFDPPRAYVKALAVEDFLFLSGAGGRGENMQIQARTSFDRIGETLKEVGSSWDKALMISCYVKGADGIDTVYKTAMERVGRNTPLISLALANEYANPEMMLEVEVTAYR